MVKYHLLLLGEKDPKLTFVAENKLGSAVYLSGKCKRLPRQLVELSLTKKITKFAEVIARSKCGIFTEILDITTT